jgi:hypothetical protein
MSRSSCTSRVEEKKSSPLPYILQIRLSQPEGIAADVLSGIRCLRHKLIEMDTG